MSSRFSYTRSDSSMHKAEVPALQVTMRAPLISPAAWAMRS